MTGTLMISTLPANWLAMIFWASTIARPTSPGLSSMMNAASARLNASTAVNSKAARLIADSDLRLSSGLLLEATIEPNPCWYPVHQALISLQERRQGSSDMGITTGLRSGQDHCITAQMRKMRR